MRFTKNAKSLMATMKTAKMTTMAANTIKITFVDQEVINIYSYSKILSSL